MKRLFFLVAILSSGCGAKQMDRAQVMAMVAQDRGLFAGVEIGDTWESVKAKHDPRWTVRDESTGSGPIRQLRLDLGEPFRDSVYVGFNTTPAGVIYAMELEIRGESANAVVVRRLDDDLLDFYDKKLGKADCSSGACYYKLPGGKQSMFIAYSQGKDKPISSTVGAHVVNLAITSR